MRTAAVQGAQFLVDPEQRLLKRLAVQGPMPYRETLLIGLALAVERQHQIGMSALDDEKRRNRPKQPTGIVPSHTPAVADPAIDGTMAHDYMSEPEYLSHPVQNSTMGVGDEAVRGQLFSDRRESDRTLSVDQTSEVSSDSRFQRQVGQIFASPAIVGLPFRSACPAFRVEPVFSGSIDVEGHKRKRSFTVSTALGIHESDYTTLKIGREYLPVLVTGHDQPLSEGR